MEFKKIFLDELKLWLVPGIGPLTFYKLKSYFHNDIAELFNSDKTSLVNLKLTEEITTNLLNCDKLNENLDQELEYIQKHNIKIIRFSDKEYPEKLKNIYAPPPFLFVKGNEKNLKNRSIAIVGTRYPSDYGKKMARKIAEELAMNGITVVSGLARGVDSEAHKGALEFGNTIGVIGSGFRYIYPSENKKLYEKILEKNVIITELTFNMTPEKFNFPNRNRIISGLSDVILVVEATEKSGSLITATHALEQGKEIFALPGEITNPRAFGTNSLIRDGARILVDINDILEEFDCKMKIEKNNEIREIAINNLTENETQIFNFIQEKRTTNFEEIASNFNININDLIGRLLSLELKNLIKELPGKFYSDNV